MGNITHPFVSTIADGDDETLVRPSNWNADHSVSAPVNDDDVATKEYVDAADEVLDYGLSFRGVVTAVVDTTHFDVASLIGIGSGFFKPTAGSPYEIYVVKADGAAPEGEQTPVVAFTNTTGRFQHIAFTASLAIGDIVLIQHPAIAALGTKASVAATGAVTTTNNKMEYIKQLVTELQVVDALVDAILVDTGTTLPATLATIAAYLDTEIQTIIDNLATVDTVVDGIQTDLSNGSDGLGALKILIDAVKTVVDANTPAGPTKTEMDNGHGLLATEAKQDIIDAIVDNIDDAVQHTTHIYPVDTNLTCTFTAGQPTNAWGAWAEITDSGANTLSSIFSAISGHISSIMIETISEDDTIYMAEIAYGDDKITLVALRFAGGTKFQAPNVQNRMWPLPFTAGETIYYRMKTATAVANTCTVHFRYHLH